MEKEEKNIFYAGIAEGEWGKRRELCRKGLPIRKMSRKLSYLTYEGRNVQAKLQVYFALLPQYEKSILGRYRFYKYGKNTDLNNPIWKAETAAKLVGQAADAAADAWGCRDHLLDPLLGGGKEELPGEVMAAYLYQLRPFDSVCILLPEDGEYFAEQALWLLRPYLPRIRQAAVCNGESENGQRIREELYLEFGLVAMQTVKPLSGMVYLDLRNEAERLPEAVKLAGDKPAGDFKCVNRDRTWKFLDTMVKNGYNTKVN
ncbi:MAG: hypothetical protein Q4D94_10065 [Bacillota bacterium]|nr:hypothetical protein [Bacillota bacterium]